MRNMFVGALVFLACADSPPPETPAKSPPPATTTATPSAAPAPKTEKLTADTPKKTTEGATFLAPAEWALSVRGPATILEAPEGDSRVALVDVHAKDADAAVAAAWAAYAPDKKWPLEVTTDAPDKDGKLTLRDNQHEYVFTEQ